MVLLFDLPSQERLNNWGSIKVLIAPPDMKEITYNENNTKQLYLDQGFQERSISVSRQYSYSVGVELGHCQHV